MTFYAPDVAERHRLALPGQREAVESGVSKFEFRLLAFVILSFSYEIPLVYITSMYKANPYLFDVSSTLLIFYWLVNGRQRWKMSLRNPIAAPWLLILAAFIWATAVSATWVPFKYYKFSIWYMWTYLQGFFVLMIFLAVPFTQADKRRLMWVVLIGGTWCAIVAVLQVFGIMGTARVIPKGWEIGMEGTGIISTLGPTYFHAGFFSVITTLIGIALFQASRGSARFIAGVLAGLCAIPAVVCGARAAFLALVISVGVQVFNSRELRKSAGTWALGLVVLSVLSFFYAGSLTQYRTSLKYEEGQYQQEASLRIGRALPQIFEELKEHPIMMVAGGGFYVVPRGTRWRVGYGIHNLYLLPFEQAGIVALIGSLWLWWRLGSNLGRRTPNPSESSIDVHVRGALFGYFVALLIVGWAGGHFWMKGATEHLNTYLILMLGLAMTETGRLDSTSPVRSVADGQNDFAVPFLDR